MYIACIGYTIADEIVVPNVIIPKGGKATLDIQLNNEQVLSPNFEFYLRLPDGITVVRDSEKLGGRFNGTGVTMSCTPNEGRYWILAMLLPPGNAPIPEESGTIVTLDLLADDSLEEGVTLNASIEDITFNTWFVDKSGVNAGLPSPVNFTITIGEPDDGRIKFYEYATSLPTYTAGTKGNVRMTRTIKANQWSTIVLPFNLTRKNAKAVFGDDVAMAKFTGFVVDYGDDEENIVPLGITLNFTSYTIPAQGGRLEGGTPVLIKTSKDITEPFELDDVNLTEDIKDVKVDFVLNEDYTMHGKFTGTLVKTKVPADGLFISDEKFYYSTGATNIKAFRGWFELEAVLDKETDFGVKMFVDDIETKVDGISVRDAEGTIYDLSGRKVNSPSRRGVYIVNGKKVMK